MEDDGRRWRWRRLNGSGPGLELRHGAASRAGAPVTGDEAVDYMLEGLVIQNLQIPMFGASLARTTHPTLPKPATGRTAAR